jgi:hypothetical protein
MPVLVAVPISNKNGITAPMETMRSWFNKNRINPSIFKYEFRGKTIIFNITFYTEDEAKKFSNEFIK